MVQLLFDIDQTLLDADKYNAGLRRRFAAILNCTEDEIFHIRKDEYVASLANMNDFNPHDLVTFLLKHFPTASRAELEAVYFATPEVYSQGLYDEAIPVLRGLSQDYKLGIYTEGNLEYQWMKFNSFGISELIDPKLIFVWQNKTGSEALSSLPGGSVIVDDNPRIIQALKEFRRDIFPILLDRKGNQPTHGAISVRSLSEIKDLELLKQLQAHHQEVTL